MSPRGVARRSTPRLQERLEALRDELMRLRDSLNSFL